MELLRQRFGDFQTLPSGLRYKVLRAPEAAERPTKGASCEVHYRGTFLNGREFDSSYRRGAPFTFRLGLGRVIAGWDEAVADMGRGEKRVLAVPYWLAYGERGSPGIPPKSHLVFEVELIGFTQPQTKPGVALPGAAEAR